MKKIEIQGTLNHVIYSPKGTIEGLLMTVDGKPVQVVAPPHSEGLAQLEAAAGAPLVLSVDGNASGSIHRVYQLVEVKQISGKSIPAAGDSVVAKGKVARLNYARHGDPNGVVLDTGDFIHTRPDNMARLALKPGDSVSAQGLAGVMSNGARVIEATVVNGVQLAKKVPAKKAAKKVPAKKALAKKAAKKAAK